MSISTDDAMILLVKQIYYSRNEVLSVIYKFPSSRLTQFSRFLETFIFINSKTAKAD